VRTHRHEHQDENKDQEQNINIDEKTKSAGIAVIYSLVFVRCIKEWLLSLSGWVLSAFLHAECLRVSPKAKGHGD